MSVSQPESDTRDWTLQWPDMQEAFPCERNDKSTKTYVSCGGENPAEWVLRLAPCCAKITAYVLWCTSCKDHVLALPVVHCTHCKHIWRPAYEAYLTVEPLWGNR
jgi:hypothetical protein